MNGAATVPEAEQSKADIATLQRIHRGLRMVTVPFPHLAGLAAAVRVALDDSVPTMGIFASGRLVANRAFALRLSPDDLVFVLAHELLHLALRTHDRAVGSGRLEFNYAHDYIINDMLRHALGIDKIPAGGLDMPGARERSAEEIVLEMRRSAGSTFSRSQVWDGAIVSLDQVLGAGGAPSAAQGKPGDVLDAATERAMFPGSAEEQAERSKAMRDLATKGMAIARALGLLQGRSLAGAGSQQQVRALRGVHRMPWQVALQRWLEGTTPGERTFMRASRRGADRTDIVMPGRQRHSMTLNVILDTSGSMTTEIPFALGAIADFCEATGVDDIRVVQCDTTVTADEVLTPAELAIYEIKGYGGSDLTPAMLALADDARISAAVIITDGDVTYPSDSVPYAVLWAVPGASTTFAPPYGRVISMQREISP